MVWNYLQHVLDTFCFIFWIFLHIWIYKTMIIIGFGRSSHITSGELMDRKSGTLWGIKLKKHVVILFASKKQNVSILNNLISGNSVLDTMINSILTPLSGGTIIIWQGAKVLGQLIFENEYTQTDRFYSSISNQIWQLTNIYAPCTPSVKIEFLQWF